MKTQQVNALKKNPGNPIGIRIVAGAAILLLNVNMAFAVEADSAKTPAQNAPQATATVQTPNNAVPTRSTLIAARLCRPLT